VTPQCVADNAVELGIRAATRAVVVVRLSADPDMDLRPTELATRHGEQIHHGLQMRATPKETSSAPCH
jgi:hypothetical protein